jgi:hypothetical protein
MASLSQLPDVVDLSFVAGDTFKIRVRIIDPTQTGPTDLGGYKITADIKKSYTDAGAIGGFDVYTSDGTLIDPNTNPAADPDTLIPLGTTEILLVLSPVETWGLLASAGGANEFHGVWDLEVTFANGDVRTVAKGQVNCFLDVTNSGG